MIGPDQKFTGETSRFYGKVLELREWKMKDGGYGAGWFWGADLIEVGYGPTMQDAREELEKRMDTNYSNR